MPFKSILCPTDLSPMSIAAMKKAVELARAFGAKLTLLHVQEDFMDKDEMIMLRVSVDHFQEVQKQRALEAKKIMVEEVEQAGGADLDVQYLLREGQKPYKVILQIADEIGADLIMMATNGRTGFEELVLGSNAENVVRRSKCPVLTIRVNP
ncbi:universal stress protein [Candidatus Poribacteria bacterium]|nr:universal stress protein [Candidatus Poribacteria bacterium]